MVPGTRVDASKIQVSLSDAQSEEKMKSVNAFVASMFEGVKEESNQHGNTVRRKFMSSSRYVVDFAEDFLLEGWQQFDTDQDAAYFGFWVNSSRRETLIYAEGDWTLVSCPTWDSYVAEIRSAVQHFGEGFIVKGLNQEGVLVTLCQDRAEFFNRPAAV